MGDLLFAVILIGSIVGLGLMGVKMKFNGRKVAVYKYQRPDLTDEEWDTVGRLNELKDVVKSNMDKVKEYFKNNQKLIFLEYIRKYHPNLDGERLYDEIDNCTFLPKCLSNLVLFANEEIIISKAPIRKLYLIDVIRYHERLSGFINDIKNGKDTHVVMWKYRDDFFFEKIHGCKRTPMPKYDNA